jgi:hypothetical protein
MCDPLMYSIENTYYVVSNLDQGRNITSKFKLENQIGLYKSWGVKLTFEQCFRMNTSIFHLFEVFS